MKLNTIPNMHQIAVNKDIAEMPDSMLEMMGLTREDVTGTIPVYSDDEEEDSRQSYDFSTHEEFGIRYFRPNG